MRVKSHAQRADPRRRARGIGSARPPGPAHARVGVSALICGLLAAAGCSSGPDYKAALIKDIRAELPGQLERLAGMSVTVGDVDCIDQGDRKYRCIAMVSEKTITDIPVMIAASCDDEGCEWRSDQ